MAKPIKFKQANVVWKMTTDDGEGVTLTYQLINLMMVIIIK